MFVSSFLSWPWQPLCWVLVHASPYFGARGSEAAWLGGLFIIVCPVQLGYFRGRFSVSTPVQDSCLCKADGLAGLSAPVPQHQALCDRLLTTMFSPPFPLSALLVLVLVLLPQRLVERELQARHPRAGRVGQLPHGGAVSPQQLRHGVPLHRDVRQHPRGPRGVSARVRVTRLRPVPAAPGPRSQTVSENV